MERSNLRLFSNIYPWKGRWREGDQEFVAKIWDDKALNELKIDERKKEVSLTPYQKELFDCTIQCPHLPKGERPWGWIASGQIACRCRKTNCPRFRECRGEQGALTEREREIWSGGNREGLDAFEKTWLYNDAYIEKTRDTGSVDLIAVFSKGEYDPVSANTVRRFDPNIASGYPDDEEYE